MVGIAKAGLCRHDARDTCLFWIWKGSNLCFSFQIYVELSQDCKVLLKVNKEHGIAECEGTFSNMLP